MATGRIGLGLLSSDETCHNLKQKAIKSWVFYVFFTGKVKIKAVLEGLKVTIGSITVCLPSH